MHYVGEFPAQVDGVLQTQVEPGAAHGEVHVRGIADEKDVPFAVSGRDARVDAGEAAELHVFFCTREPHRERGADDALDALLQLRKRHRLSLVFGRTLITCCGI
ncbi:Uncharacterised protein [Mycobacteroides abscessus]|uniref:Uncharacterized protein n=1 Tax=Mycobacteroides abscessus TaxID=36809 RepID=A0AB33T9Z8_9MYCO|nr:Uncharacterised protein [Mycobacteroides abscessus]CPU97522.1 Uncharacterised protein [Mycobacteroides abscessus]CPV66514.1 Uncharacterised protein [Mycobacteroides abscessus]CPX81748.1 Uncharacterised protein [Mycobacteroides abscessus]